MGITANSGPMLVYGLTTTSSGAVTEYNEERGPSIYDCGQAIADPRQPFCYLPGAPVGTKIYGLWDNVGTVDALPSVQNSSINYTPGTIVSCLTGSTAYTVATALTLNTSASANTTGITYNVSITAPENGQSVVMPIAIDYTTPQLTFGSGGTAAMWNPANGIARCIAITGSSSGLSDSGTIVSVYGRDIYGFKMTENIVMGSSSLNGVIGNKAFKYIAGITISGASQINSSHINIGFADKFGFPTRVDTPLYIQQLISATSASSVVTQYSINTVNGVTFALSTGTTPSASGTGAGDVRGTWTSTGSSATASWAANARLQMYCTLNPVNIQTMSLSSVILSSTPAAAIFGLPQYSSV